MKSLKQRERKRKDRNKQKREANDSLKGNKDRLKTKDINSVGKAYGRERVARVVWV